MFNKYLVINEDNKRVLFLYVSDNFEFANDTNKVTKKSKKKDNIYNKVNDYIKNNDINFNGNKVNFIKDGITLGHIDLSDYDFNYDRYVEVINPINNKLVNYEKSFSIIENLKLEEYLLGVVGGEMPAVYEIEALKAEAVLARTYALKRLKNNLSIDNINETQIYRDKNHLKDIWQDNYIKYYNKILKSIRDTKNEVIMYNNDFVDCYSHLSSNGKTEDANNILDNNHPYLKSVDSMIDKNSNNTNFKFVPNDYLSKLLNININKDTKVNVLIKTIGNRVKYIKFDNKVFDGLVLSKRLGLNSNDFTVEIGDEFTKFTTFGYGNGLGLSKSGANEMAKRGYNYIEILHHYYPHTYIENIEI